MGCGWAKCSPALGRFSPRENALVFLAFLGAMAMKTNRKDAKAQGNAN
jgi:hypothetical protein